MTADTVLLTIDWPSLVHVHLGWGRDKARTIGDIAESMNVSRRIVERAIETLRHQGYPVISGDRGIYLTTDAAEIRACADRLNMRVRHQYATVRAMRQTARRHAGVQQMALFDAV